MASTDTHAAVVMSSMPEILLVTHVVHSEVTSESLSVSAELWN